MDSATHRVQEDVSRKEELQRQIERLQAELATIPQTEIVNGSSPKRKKQPEPTVLAPATPSPRKKRKLNGPLKGDPIAKPLFQPASKVNGAKPLTSVSSKPPTTLPHPPKPSNLIQKLAQVKAEPSVPKVEQVNRSISFSERPGSPGPIRNEESVSTARRDDRLMLIDEFEPGPYDFTPPSDDPLFEKLEPHSGIVLSSRSLPHEDLSDHLRGRYYLSPSRLYSSIRLQPDKQGYDVPVPGDWVTIAVIAERGPVRMTKAPVTLGPDEDNPKNKWRKTAEAGPQKPHGKHFVSMKLVDFGARTKSSATGGKAVVRGDAFLSLLLFEADAVEKVTSDDGGRPQKIYRGGSRGAYEMFDKLKPGDVIALLNPKILKPYQRSSDKPHPVDNILAVTPESASSIAVLGKSRDLGRCGVRKRDGTNCGGWCDKRVSEVCEYHVQTAVQHRRAARPEFTAGTGGMNTKATVKRKTEYDPVRQWGLQPELKHSESSTYIVSGHIVSGSSSNSLFATENIGREGQAKAQRKLAKAEADKVLKQLAERDRDGMEAVLKAREAMGPKESKGKAKVKQDTTEDEGMSLDGSKKRYSSNIIRSLGFDPTVKAGHRRLESPSTESKFEALQALSAKRNIALGRAPKKVSQETKRSIATDDTLKHEKSPAASLDGEEDETMIDLDDI